MLNDRRAQQLNKFQSMQQGGQALNPRQERRMNFLQDRQMKGMPQGVAPRPGMGQQLPGGRLPNFQGGSQQWNNVRPMPMPGRDRQEQALDQAVTNLSGGQGAALGGMGGAGRLQRTLSDFGPMRPGAQSQGSMQLQRMADFGPNRPGYKNPALMQPVGEQMDFGPRMGKGY